MPTASCMSAASGCAGDACLPPGFIHPWLPLGECRHRGHFLQNCRSE
jgi:hypothetical protein